MTVISNTDWPASAPGSAGLLINRELSLLEQLKFLCIALPSLEELDVSFRLRDVTLDKIA